MGGGRGNTYIGGIQADYPERGRGIQKGSPDSGRMGGAIGFGNQEARCDQRGGREHGGSRSNSQPSSNRRVGGTSRTQRAECCIDTGRIWKRVPPGYTARLNLSWPVLAEPSQARIRQGSIFDTQNVHLAEE